MNTLTFRHRFHKTVSAFAQTVHYLNMPMHFTRIFMTWETEKFPEEKMIFNLKSVKNRSFLLHRRVNIIDICIDANTSKRLFAYAKTKAQISCAITAQLISSFLFAT